MTQLRFHVQFALVVLLSITACRTAGDRVPVGSAVAVVENRSWSDIRVAVRVDGAGRTLGIVPAGSTRTFAIDPEFLGAAALALSADPIGSRETFSTGPLRLADGDTVEWTIAPVPEQSTLRIH